MSSTKNLSLFSTDEMDGGAVFSTCRKYRYSLWRVWDRDLPAVCVIGVNPSTADEKINDPTIRRCIQFAKDWGYGSLFMANLFAYRATDPADMRLVFDPVGRDNDRAIKRLAYECKLTVAAWGVNGTHRDRHADVRAMVKKLHHLGLTKDGHPKHPLYLKATTKPTLWIP